MLTIPQDRGGKTSRVPLNDAALAALALPPPHVSSRLVMPGEDGCELLGHRTLAMAMRYSRLAPDFRMAAVRRMPLDSIDLAGVAKLADAQDLKSWDSKESCGFDSRPRHHVIHT